MNFNIDRLNYIEGKPKGMDDSVDYDGVVVGFR